MKISTDDVSHVADLARIKISEFEKENLSTELSEIIGYVDKLESAETKDTEPISQISGLENTSRKDEVEESLMTEKVLENAPEKDKGFFKVRKIFE